jgi:hypothetical protein
MMAKGKASARFDERISCSGFKLPASSEYGSSPPPMDLSMTASNNANTRLSAYVLLHDHYPPTPIRRAFCERIIQLTYIIDIQPRPAPTPLRGGKYLQLPRRPWLVHGVIREGTVVFLTAREGTGKSFVALEFAYCVAEGRPWYGNEVQRGEVVYVAAERGNSQRERIEALHRLKNYSPDSVTFFDFAFKFNNPDDLQLFHRAIGKLDFVPSLIIIDTLRASFDGDENNSWNAQRTMDAFAEIKQRYGCTIVVLHHVNAFGKSRGSSAFLGSADTELYMTESKARSVQRVYLTVRKQNNGRKWTKYQLDADEITFEEGFSSIVFNLSNTELVDVSPVDAEETNEREQNVLEAVETAGGTIDSLRQLQRALDSLEGTMPNRETLKKDLSRMADKGLIIYETSSPNALTSEEKRRFVIGLPSVTDD